ncbi:MAG: creatininase family protein [Burkholderiaceae bacterium]
MQLSSHFWSDLTTRQFAQLAVSKDIAQVVAVLPVAATEQHGPHLPVSVDTALVDGVVNASLSHLAHLPADLPVLFLPTQQIGKSNEHIRFPGTLTLSAQTVISLWMDIGASVARSGIKKMLILNSHGGQASIMDIVARDLRTEHDLIVYSANWYNLPLGDAVMGLFPAEEHRFGIHAGDIETSMMLALQETSGVKGIDMTQAKNFHSTSQDRADKYAVLGNGTSAKLGWQMQDYNPQGAAGNAAAATAAKGHALLDAAGLQLANLLKEISDLPLSTLKPAPEFPE